MKSKKGTPRSKGSRFTRKPRRAGKTTLERLAANAVWNTTQSVEVENAGTISRFLNQKGLAKRSPLAAPKPFDVTSVLRVDGGEKYVLGKTIAEGGMGIVREASDLNCRRVVAMKMLRVKDPRYEQEDLLRFIEEAQITSQLEHPNIVPVHDLGVDALGNVYYTMKYMKGSLLSDVLDAIRHGQQDVIEQYPLARLLTIFQKTCDAIAFAHSRSVVHRDLKPDNVMIGGFGEVVVMDWGLAKVLSSSQISTSAEEAIEPLPADETAPPADLPTQRLRPRETTVSSIRTDTIGTNLKTMSGRIMGTPGFMAPEQARPDHPVDERTDIYALGAILYSILTLRPPVRGDNLKDVLLKVVRGDIVPPAVLNRWLDLPQERSGKYRFPHCPGGQIPIALSDIAMKAMALDPADRYQSVRALQRDVEAYQDGLIWHLVTDEDFSRPDALSRWEVIGGHHEWKEGELRLYGGEPQLLLLRRDVPGDVRIEFVCRQESAYLNDVGCFLSAVRTPNKKEIPASGYELKYGGYSNTLNVLMKCNQRLWSCPASPLIRGKTYRVVAERIGSRLRMEVNGEEIFRVTDPDPLSGVDRTAVGLLGWMADTRFTRVRVLTLGAPWKSDVLEIAERQLRKGHYNTAMDLFEDILQSAPEPDRAERAQRGFETARMRRDMQERLPEWQAQLREAWPDIPAQLRIDNNGLTAELPPAGITDLSPLQGLPLTALYCAGNRIGSLEPLRGMALVTLNCGGNPIADLEPLRGMPLQTLLCECTKIRSLTPLRDSPLVMLNCGGCPLQDGLEPLRGMKLTWLACWGCGLDSLEPLRGMPLQNLYCDANRIVSLGPLAGMPLAALFCSCNLIESLEPLAGMPLVILHCGGNRITSLEPLRGMSLTMFSCHDNRITSLDPLVGMPLGSCTCGANPLRSIGTLIRNPPDSFLFDSDDLPTEELEWIYRTWSRDFRFAAHAQHAEILLTLRREKPTELRRFATEFNGHYYLFVPRLLTWDEARELCESAGGHLVTIADKAENDFVASLFPRGSWCWMGLVTKDGRHEWVTGEPVTFTSFVDPLREQIEGPKVFASGTWSWDVWPTARNGFVIEWES
jgi:serine/threonine protein kinase